MPTSILLHQLVDFLPLPAAILAPDGTLIHVNTRLCALLGTDAAGMKGRTLDSFRTDGAMGADGSGDWRSRHAIAGRRGRGRAKGEFATAKGQSRPVIESSFEWRDGAGRLTHFVHVLEDQRPHRVAKDLAALAYHDGLTGLPNRTLFDQKLSSTVALAQRGGLAFALLYVDIDHFKQVNDRFGHAAGDDLLRQLTDRMRHCLRRTDTLARLGGDEFAIILEQAASAAAASDVARKLLRNCCGQYEFDKGTVFVTISIGAALYPVDAEDGHVLLNAADQFMYRAKTAGRNTFRVGESEIHEQYRVVKVFDSQMGE